MVSAKGGRKGFVFRDRWTAYRALRKKGKSESTAAAIANEGHTKAGRSAMGKKAAQTRKRKGK
jgi:hypothetical protein